MHSISMTLSTFLCPRSVFLYLQPYLSQNGYCKANSAGRTAVLKGYVNVTSGSETALMTALANMGPVSISVDAAVGAYLFPSSAACLMLLVALRPSFPSCGSHLQTSLTSPPVSLPYPVSRLFAAADTFSFYSSGVLDDP